ncbi:MAG: 2,4'-dihydroxyacetophenone dioxygenase family protein [Dokdonella sp.]
MTATTLLTRNPITTASLPARVLAQACAPWVPLSAGKAFKPLRLFADNRGFVELLRLDPGTAIPLHRHTGEVHAFNLEGTRELDSGERVGPGDYVYEPAGNTDAWKVVGDVPLVVLVIVTGAVEYLDADGAVIGRYTAERLFDLYLAHCEGAGIEPLDLID